MLNKYTRTVKSEDITKALESLINWYYSFEDPLAGLAAIAVIARAYEMAGGFPMGTDAVDRMAVLFAPMFTQNSAGDA